VSRTRPAPLSSDLLAPKGGATPAIRDKSPILRSVEASAAPVVAKLPFADPAPVADTSPEPALVAEAIGAPPPRASDRRRIALFAAALAVALAAAVAIGVARREEPAPPPAPPQPEAAVVEPSAASVEPQPAVPEPVEAAADVPPAAPDLAPAAPAPAEPPTPMAEPAASVVPPPKAKPPVAPEAPAANGRYAVQFASVRSAEGARQEAQRIARKLNATLQGRDLAVVRAETRERGTRYRVVANGYATLAVARAVCTAARARDEDCLVIRR